jgi:hypothetical protein
MEGAMLSDTLTIGSLSATVTVGAISTVQEGFQEAPANGIMGVSASSGNCNSGSFASSQTSDSVTCAEDTMQALLTANGYGDKFGVCLGVDAPGVLSLGGANSDFYTAPMLATPLVTSTSGENYYSVDLTGFGVGGSTICTGTACVGSQTAIVDTGTAVAQLNTEAYTALASSSVSCSSDDGCLVDFQFGGDSPMCIQSKGLMTCVGGTCQIDTEMVNSGSGQTIIGYTALKYLYLQFDRAGMEVGFAERSGECSVECTSYLSQFGCGKASCSWDGSSCSGGQGSGSTAVGSKVVSGTCISSGGTATAAATTANDDDYNNPDSGLGAAATANTKSSSSVSTGLIGGVAAAGLVVVAAAFVLFNRRHSSMTEGHEALR